MIFSSFLHILQDSSWRLYWLDWGRTPHISVLSAAQITWRYLRSRDLPLSRLVRSGHSVTLPLRQSNGAAYHSRREIPSSLWLHVRLGYQVVWKWNRVFLLCCRLAIIKPFRCKLSLLRSSVFMIRIDLWVFIAKPKYMCTQERF